MRLSNRNKAGFYQFLSTLHIVLFFSGVSMFLLERYNYHKLGFHAYLLLLIPALLLIVFFWRGRQIFEYDSDGEALNFKNRNVILFLNKTLNDEFPKYKLISYEIVNFIILKKLYVTVSSKKSHTLILNYDISYLTKKELNDLNQSLKKVSKLNRENKETENT